ncbi:hypothetical protein BCEN4_590021 [Burkholderia cenocepacia]|nr:hypothetical protein BCEN4_590021 [Burkholderia cenocepacia]
MIHVSVSFRSEDGERLSRGRCMRNATRDSNMRPSAANPPPPLYVNSKNRGRGESAEIACDSMPQAIAPPRFMHTSKQLHAFTQFRRPALDNL